MTMVISSEKGFLDLVDSGEGRGGDKGLWQKAKGGRATVVVVGIPQLGFL